VVTEARRSGVFLLLMHEVMAELRRRAVPSLFATITHTNHESVAAHERLEYRVVLTLSRVQFPGAALYRSRPPGERACWAMAAHRAPAVTIAVPG
jgi:L-amino acid N-acyltransferase YncA